MSDLAWFPLYPERFRNSRTVRRMSAEEVGTYFLLLLDQWTNGPIPDDDDELEIITKADPSIARAVLKQCFQLASDGWTNGALEEIRAEQESKRDKRVRAGRKGGKAKRANEIAEASNAKAMLKQCSSNALAIEENREEENRREKKERETRADGGAFNALYQSRPSGPLLTAESAYYRAVDDGAEPDALARRWPEYCRRQEAAGLNVPHLANWLSRGGWADASLDERADAFSVSRPLFDLSAEGAS